MVEVEWVVGEGNGGGSKMIIFFLSANKNKIKFYGDSMIEWNGHSLGWRKE